MAKRKQNTSHTSPAAAAMLSQLELAFKTGQELVNNGFDILTVSINKLSKSEVFLAYTPRCQKLGGQVTRQFYMDGSHYKEVRTAFGDVHVIWYQPVDNIMGRQVYDRL